MSKKHLPKYVKEEHGYYYFRRRGTRVKLPGLPYSEEFQKAYYESLAGGVREIGANRTVPGTINAAIVAYLKHRAFTEGKEASTRDVDKRILEGVRREHGEKRVRTLERRHIELMLSDKDSHPHAQRSLLRVLRGLLDFTVLEGIRKDNPARLIKLAGVKTKGFHSWTDEEVAQYESKFPIGTKARLAFALMFFTASRRSDAYRIGPANCRDGRIKLTQQKTKVEVDIPMAKPLADTIAATNMVGIDAYLLTDKSKPFKSAQSFYNYFKKCCVEADLAHCSPHGLRKAFLRRMADAGCSEDYIASISGHTDMREIRTYVQAANRARMATEAMAKVLEHPGFAAAGAS
jgi:integrase